MSEIIDYGETRKVTPVATKAIWGYGLSEPLPILSFGFTHEAMRMTRELLDSFEKSEFPHIKYKILNCIGLWFLSMESGISTVLKILSLTHEIPKFKNLPEKFSAIPRIVNSKTLPSEMQVNEIKEFCCFRNATFHDLYYERKKAQYTQTLFSNIPAYANEIDLIEATRISINSLSFYRYAIQGMSLIENNNDIVEIYQNQLIPKFQQIIGEKKFKPVKFRSLDLDVSPPLTPNTYSGVIKY